MHFGGNSCRRLVAPTVVYHVMLLVLCLPCWCVNTADNATIANTTELGVPSEPDIALCSPIYGDSLRGTFCRQALANMFPGRLPRLINVVKHRSGTSSTTLQVPFEYTNGGGSCKAIFCNVLFPYMTLSLFT